MQYALGIVVACKISKGLAYIITLYTISSLDGMISFELIWNWIDLAIFGCYKQLEILIICRDQMTEQRKLKQRMGKFSSILYKIFIN